MCKVLAEDDARKFMPCVKISAFLCPSKFERAYTRPESLR
jgi:hypothetical protein